MNEIPEERIRAAQQGDREAFHELYTLTARLVYGTALRIVHNTADAEDVAQEVYVKMHRFLPQFAPGTSLAAWLYRITVNTAITTYNKRSRDSKKQEEAGGLVSAQVTTPEVDTVVEREYRQQVIEKLLAVLNPDQRACIVLRDIEGLEYKEIAQVLNVKINTVRTRLKRARQAMLQYAREEKVCHGM